MTRDWVLAKDVVGQLKVGSKIEVSCLIGVRIVDSFLDDDDVTAIMAIRELLNPEDGGFDGHPITIYRNNTIRILG